MKILEVKNLAGLCKWNIAKVDIIASCDSEIGNIFGRVCVCVCTLLF